MKDKLLEKMFEYDRWISLIDKAEEKGINKSILRQLCTPEQRLRLYEAIKSEDYEIAPPHLIEIPKDNGKMRQVYANEDIDRIVCTLANDCVMELFADMIHPSCVSYQKSLGSQEVVQRVSREIARHYDGTHKVIGAVTDFTKYFDSIYIEKIDEIFDKWERRLGFKQNTEPVINMFRKYYHSELYFDLNNELQSKYLSLRQGCALAAALADMILYELDDFMSKKYKIYYRYSDDCITIGSNVREIVNDVNSICTKYGTSLNDNKVKAIYTDEWVKFLGFNLHKDLITLSKNRTHKITKELVKVTISNPNVGKTQAIKNIKRILYGSDNSQFSWATACFNAMNCFKDVETLNNFIMDLIRICEERESYNKCRKAKGLKPRVIKYGMNDVGGIGIENKYDDHTMTRGTGKKVRTAKQRTEKEIENYISMGCLLGVYKLGKPMYDSVLAGWQ